MSVSYWDRGIDNVPHVTGASQVMDCSDLVDACRGLGVDLPLVNVLDVGCGTGRWSKFCKGYVGADVSMSAVAYCRLWMEVDARIIFSPYDLPIGPFDVVCCFSVFTHIGSTEREEYLKEFASCTNRLLVDVIPGDGRGDIALWTADLEQFENSVLAAGFVVTSTYSRISPDGVEHRYYRLDKE